MNYFLSKVAELALQLYWNWTPLLVVFCEFAVLLKSSIVIEHLGVTASDTLGTKQITFEHPAYLCFLCKR